MTTPTLAIVGLTSASFLCGKLFAQSWSATPALLHAPAPLLAQQWRTMFLRDIYLAPASVLVASGAWGLVSYRLTPPFGRAKLLFAASAVTLSLMVPYSAFLLEPINRMLERRAQGPSFASFEIADALEKGLMSAADEFEFATDGQAPDVHVAWERQSVHVLVDRWATVNAGRAVLTGIAVLLAGSATLAL